MDSKVLFVRSVTPDDSLGDISEGVLDIARDFGCRCVMMVGSVSCDQAAQITTSQEPVPEVSQIAAPGHQPLPSTNGHAAPEATQETSEEPGENRISFPPDLTKRQLGAITFLAAPLYPTSDDLNAVRNEVAKLGSDEISVLIVNPHYGEYAIPTLLANNSANLFCAHDLEFVEELAQVFQTNLGAVDQIRLIDADKVSGLDDQGVNVLILVDSPVTEFAKYSRHLRYGGLLILATTNGSSPDKPEPLLGRLTDITNSVSIMYRKNIVSDGVGPSKLSAVVAQPPVEAQP